MGAGAVMVLGIDSDALSSQDTLQCRKHFGLALNLFISIHYSRFFLLLFNIVSAFSL